MYNLGWERFNKPRFQILRAGGTRCRWDAPVPIMEMQRNKVLTKFLETE